MKNSILPKLSNHAVTTFATALKLARTNLLLRTRSGCAAAIAVSLLFSSCASTQFATVSVKSESAPAKAPGMAGWVMVAENPPTFFPVGLSRHAKTDHRYGEWVLAGGRGSRCFIPRGGIDGRSELDLRKEAFSMRTDSEKTVAGMEKTGDFVEKSLWSSVLISGAMLAGMSGCDADIDGALETVWSR